jgi:hypothetical protein
VLREKAEDVKASLILRADQALAINVFAVSYSLNLDDLFLDKHLIDNPVVANANAVGAF